MLQFQLFYKSNTTAGQNMMQLTNKQHLVYMLQNSHLVTSLPFVDQQLDSQIPKSKVLYLIKTQQQAMQKDPSQYIKDLRVPQLNYADSEDFQKELERVLAKADQKEKGEGQSKKKQQSFPDIPKKIVASQRQKISAEVNKGVALYQNSVVKNINLQLSRKYGPLLLKEMIQVLQKQKSNLQTAIQNERQSISQLNKNRKYDQMQAYQREYDIGERVKIMLNKRRKVE